MHGDYRISVGDVRVLGTRTRAHGETVNSTSQATNARFESEDWVGPAGTTGKMVNGDWRVGTRGKFVDPNEEHGFNLDKAANINEQNEADQNRQIMSVGGWGPISGALNPPTA